MRFRATPPGGRVEPPNAEDAGAWVAGAVPDGWREVEATGCGRSGGYSAAGARFVTDHTMLYIHCFDEHEAKTIDRQKFPA